MTKAEGRDKSRRQAIHDIFGKVPLFLLLHDNFMLMVGS